MIGRHPVVVEQFKNATLELKDNNGNYTVDVDAPLFPDVDAPGFVIDGVPQQGGTIDGGETLLFSSASDGTVFYTTDGTDPRQIGGDSGPTAQAYDGTITTSTLITTGSTWQYLDIGEAQEPEWKDPGFNDSTWSSGIGKFGFGDSQETLITSGPNGNRHTTTYFRQEFSSTGDYDTATLSINRDDGVVVYLNGVEIVRDNLPDGPIEYDTFALSTVGGSAESQFFDFDIPASMLLAGVNTIAVEVHQARNSNDLGFDAELTVGQVTSGTPISLDTTTLVLSRTLGSDGTWSPLQSAEFVVAGSVAPQSSIRISEINFNPADPSAAEMNAGHDNNDNFEFIELYNSSTTGTVDLAGMQFDDGITFTFGDVQLGPR